MLIFQVALPADVISALSRVRLASHWMFALYLTGATTCFVSIFLTPLSVYTRWATFPIAIFAFLTALTTTAASIIATVMFMLSHLLVPTQDRKMTQHFLTAAKLKWLSAAWEQVVRYFHQRYLKEQG